MALAPDRIQTCAHAIEGERHLVLRLGRVHRRQFVRSGDDHEIRIAEFVGDSPHHPELAVLGILDSIPEIIARAKRITSSE